MKKQQFIVGIVVGYMLKVMKARKKELKFKEEFACIRHGNFPKFISLINGSIPKMVIYKDGKIEIDSNPRKDNYDFIGLVMSGPSMKDFYKKCVKEYGTFNDETILDEIYYEVAIYEITIRIHLNKFKTLNENDSFQTIIYNLGQYLNLTNKEVETIQKGRKILNMIKHGKKQNYSWEQSLIDFKTAIELMKKKQITLE
eukprot:TRINITY_DN661_c0_g1_i3.p2 TRINITY_DN661_c0_g1~~TRINITY_DN661_c0_g1_i3.p2  ORF type:complete len:199 (-),score=39.65 TRINITY_DN661_c0_g1_i3:629-1225(-)